MAIAEWVEPRVALDTPINVHLTGCPHSCAQHYIGDIGLLACRVPIAPTARTRWRASTSTSAAASAPDAGIARELYRDVKVEDCPRAGRAHPRSLPGATARGAAETFLEFSRRHDTDALKAMVDAHGGRRMTIQNRAAGAAHRHDPGGAPFSTGAARLAQRLLRRPAVARRQGRHLAARPATCRMPRPRRSPASDDGAPWHDAAMPIDERMQLAEGRPLPRQLFAAMAQQDCGQCGYLCETYSAAIAAGTETKLNLCVPGGKETSRMLKRLLEEAPRRPPPARPAQRRPPSRRPREPGYCRERPVEAIFRSATRLNGAGSEKDTRHVVLRHLRQRPHLRAGRQLRPLSDQRSRARRCGAGRHARAAGLSRRRQDVPRRR